MNSIARFGAVLLLAAAGCPGSGAQTTPVAPGQGEMVTDQGSPQDGQQATEGKKKPEKKVRPDDPNERWNLGDMYATDQAWAEALTAFKARLPELDALPGTLGKSPASMAKALELQFDLAKEIYRLSAYASMKADSDTRVPEALEMRQQSELIGTDFEKKLAFMSPELLAIGKKKIERFVKREPRLKPYAHYLDEVLRRAPHTLDPKSEKLLAATGLMADTAGTLYRLFASAELPWPTVTLEDGTAVRLDHAAYTLYRASYNRADRQKVFTAYWGKWREFERTVGAALYAELQKDLFYTRARKYKNSLELALDRAAIPETVYHMLIENTNKNLPTLHRFLRLRARMLGIADPKYHDIYAPLVESDETYPIATAKKLAVDAMGILGQEYTAPMKKGLESRWMDTYPREGKQSGAYMAGRVYDVHPYVLMNYNDDWDGVTTLAHEWGHAMHSYLSNKTQPWPTAGYATFVAEVASTFNELMVVDNVLKGNLSDDERLYFLGTELERLRGTYFRQTMFAEYELKIHELVEKGEALSGKRLSTIYLDLLRKYHGHDQGVMNIEEAYGIEWAMIHHFYYDYYVYAYATSIAAASLLAADVLANKPGAKERYLELLKSGGNGYAYELLKKAGVDMATPAPYDAIIKRMNDIMDEIEAILDRKQGK